MPKLVEAVIAKALKPYIKAKAKQQKLMEAHKLRMDRLKMMIDDHGKELANLKDRVITVEKASGGNANTTSLKVNFDLLKKEVVALRSTDSSIYFDGLEDPLKADMAMVPDNELNMNVLGEGGEET